MASEQQQLDDIDRLIANVNPAIFRTPDFKRAFDACDTDNSGSLSKTEYITLIAQSLPRNMAEKMVDKIFARFDSDRNGELTYEEFVGGFERSKVTTYESHGASSSSSVSNVSNNATTTTTTTTTRRVLADDSSGVSSVQESHSVQSLPPAQDTQSQSSVMLNLRPDDQIIQMGDGDRPTIFRRRVTRQEEVPYVRKVRVPIKQQKVVPCQVPKEITVKKLVEVQTEEEIEESYTVIEEREEIVKKTIYVPKVIEEKVVRKVPVTKTRKVKKPATKIEEREVVQTIMMPSTKLVTVDAYRIDEVEDRKIVEREEWEVYELRPHATGKTVKGAERTVGVVSHTGVRRIGDRIYHNEETTSTTTRSVAQDGSAQQAYFVQERPTKRHSVFVGNAVTDFKDRATTIEEHQLNNSPSTTTTTTRVLSSEEAGQSGGYSSGGYYTTTYTTSSSSGGNSVGVLENRLGGQDRVFKFRQVFARCDRNNDGVVSRMELIRALRSDQEVRDLLNVRLGGSGDHVDDVRTFGEAFAALDKDDSSSITWFEFLNAVAGQRR